MRRRNVTNNFLYDGSVMNGMQNEMTKAKDTIEEAYKMANNLSTRIVSSTAWGGESHTTMVAFMDLTLQYHKKFTDDGGKSPITEAIDAFKEMTTNVEEFYNKCECYKEMME